METTRVTVDEVETRLDRGEPLVFLDTRNPQAWAEADEMIKGAIRVAVDDVNAHLEEIPHDRAIITYCTCPNEASSAKVAQQLLDHGWKNVHPLFGGFDAWKRAGLPVEPVPQQQRQEAGAG